MMDDDAKGKDRRGSVRHLSCFPAHIHKADGVHIAIIRDLSVSGALILTHAAMPIGEHLELSLFIESAERAHAVTGTVIRVERRPAAVLWPFLVAVQFETVLDSLPKEIEALTEQQAKLGAVDP